MELRALRYFVTVADELHFGRAAERLHIAQPAVSRQIAQLERELGTRLFDRTPRRVRLTAAGHRVLDAARETLAAADRVRGAAGAAGGTMRIGIGAGFTTRLERGIDALREASPFDVVLVDLPLTARLAALRHGEIDLALARGVHAADGLEVLPSWTEPLLAVLSRRHPAAGRTAVGVDELAESTLRLPSRDQDPALHDAVTSALGPSARLGRPAGTPQHTVVEVGSDPGSWTVLPADQAAEVRSARVRAVPLRPRMTIAGSVITPPDLPGRCAAAHAAAFGDGLTSG
ncbi:LysR family transcriptional regulator [Amycolatopsis solani]|uniref:LysR family transcriptional regulator n=1 Tax=Amycolatopsis solani TaxID=3028615 RepID=UPI0025B102EE|nr:LysR family transcriptional regulator [Amycolatopsis sp. MEP2-6]